MSYHARVDYTGDGATSTFAIPFAYIKEADVLLYTAGVLDNTTVITWLTSGSVSLAPTPASGVAISFRRSTNPVTAVHTLQIGSMDPRDVNDLIQQTLYLAQEALDDLLAIVTTRALVAPDDNETVTNLPNVAGRKTKVLGFDGSGDPAVSLNTLANMDTAVTAYLNGLTGIIDMADTAVSGGGTYNMVETDLRVVVDATAGATVVVVDPKKLSKRTRRIKRKATDVSGNPINVEDQSSNVLGTILGQTGWLDVTPLGATVDAEGTP